MKIADDTFPGNSECEWVNTHMCMHACMFVEPIVLCIFIDCKINFTKAYLKMVGLYKLQIYENNNGRDKVYIQPSTFTQVVLGLFY